MLLSIFGSCIGTRPKIGCFDPNNVAADTSYFVRSNKYQGFIFPENYEPLLKLDGIRFTPTLTEIKIGESILELKTEYGRTYNRQYLGHLNVSGDSLIYIRLLKNGFKDECFDKIVAFGFGERYERNQRIHDINLTRKRVE